MTRKEKILFLQQLEAGLTSVNDIEQKSIIAFYHVGDDENIRLQGTDKMMNRKEFDSYRLKHSVETVCYMPEKKIL